MLNANCVPDTVAGTCPYITINPHYRSATSRSYYSSFTDKEIKAVSKVLQLELLINSRYLHCSLQSPSLSPIQNTVYFVCVF